MKVQKKQNIKNFRKPIKKLLRKNKSKRPLIAFLLLAAFICLYPTHTSAQLDFKNWQTFQRTRAFFPVLDLGEKLSFQYKPTTSSNQFQTSSSTGFSSFMVRQTPGYLDIHELGWFCTLDLKLDLRMAMPFRFRLGNLESVNRKEGYYDYRRE